MNTTAKLYVIAISSADMYQKINGIIPRMTAGTANKMTNRFHSFLGIIYMVGEIQYGLVIQSDDSVKVGHLAFVNLYFDQSF